MQIQTESNNDSLLPSSDDGSLLLSNGIPESMLDDDVKTIQLMIHWLQRHGQQRFNQSDLEGLKWELSVQPFQLLRRVVAELLQSVEGCRLLSLCGPEVASMLEVYAKQHHHQSQEETNGAEVLTLLNNISINFTSRGIKLPRPLCGLGLRLASELGSLPAVGSFLSMDNGIYGKIDNHNEYGTALRDSLFALLNHMDSQHEDTTSRSEIFSLLTGRGLASQDANSSFRVMLSNLCDSAEAQEAYRAYILLLGATGAVRSLWYEWNSATNHKTPPMDQREFIFADALTRSICRMQQHHHLTDCIDTLSQVAGNYEQDGNLDAQLVLLLDGAITNAPRETGTYSDMVQKSVLGMRPMEKKSLALAMEAVRNLIEINSGKESVTDPGLDSQDTPLSTP
jgi:hypothetical protein